MKQANLERPSRPLVPPSEEAIPTAQVDDAGETGGVSPPPEIAVEEDGVGSDNNGSSTSAGRCVSLCVGKFDSQGAALEERAGGRSVKKNRARDAYFDRHGRRSRESPASSLDIERVTDSQGGDTRSLEPVIAHSTDRIDSAQSVVRPGAIRVTPHGEEDHGSYHEDSSEILPIEESRPERPEYGETYLVEASLVLPEAREAPMLVVAQPLRRKRFWICFGVGSLVMIGVAVGISFAVIVKNRAATPTEPTPSPTLPPASTEDLRMSLPAYTLTALQNSSSPQAKAFAWLDSPGQPSLPLWRLTQRFALATFGISTGVDRWNNSSGWLNVSADVCEWSKCSCTEAFELSVLDFEDNGLEGTIPREVGLIGTLTSLVMSFNGLTGSIPTEMQLLKNLDSLALGDNDLSGSLPTELGRLSALTTLEVTGNPRIRGSLPTELSALPVLSELGLAHLNLSSTIPTEFGRFRSLAVLGLNKAGVSGPIPTELGLLPALRVLQLSENKLTSTLPTEFGNLTLLETLWLGQNDLVGPIPSELQSLSALSDLVLASNSILGSIPSVILTLENLSYLYMEEDKFTGSIPTEIGSLTNLRKVSLSKNSLTGTIPTELGYLSGLEDINLGQNPLEGSVPQEVCQLMQNGLTLKVDCNRVECNC